MEAFDLASETYAAPVSEEQFKDAVKTLDPSRPTDVTTKGKARTEQAFLRNYTKLHDRLRLVMRPAASDSSLMP
jgi:hypothetical protein